MELLGAHYGLGAGIHDVVVVDSPVSRVAAAGMVDDVLMKVLQTIASTRICYTWLKLHLTWSSKCHGLLSYLSTRLLPGI